MRFPEIEVVGHAGAGLDMERVPFPGNTQESLDFAIALGLSHVEIDLQLSSDGHWILFHDDFLQARTNFSGCIGEYNLPELENLRYNGFPNTKIPAFKDLDVSSFETVFLDIRDYRPCADFQSIDTAQMHQEIIAAAERFPNQHFVIISRRIPVLLHFKNLGFDVCFETVDVANMALASSNFGIDFFTFRNRNISANEVASARQSGWRIMLFDTKSHAGNRQAMKKNPNFVLTDAVVSALQLTQ